jgi:hypothetical protein
LRYESRLPVVPVKAGIQVRSSNPQVTPDCLHTFKHNYLVPLDCNSPGLRLGMVFR